MPPVKKTDLEKLAWSWIESVPPDNIERTHLEMSYRIGLKNCKNCKRNCSNNPRCLTGLGEEKYLKSQPAEIGSLESSLTELRDPTQYVGLKNLGATCYVNSLIQVWFHNEDMRRIIYKWEITEDPEERESLQRSHETHQPYQPVTVVGQLQYIFAMMQFGNRRLLDPTSLAIVLSLDTGTQQDAQEFSKLLLAHIEGKLQQNLGLKTMLQRLTQGTYIYVNRCSTCATEYPTPTTFYELDLQLASTLKEAMENYLSEEELVGANKYHCRNCNDKQDAKRFIRLDSLPDTLNFQLLRFVFHRESAQKKKLTSSIQFPEELDMSEYLRCPNQTHLYNLVAVLCHKGPSAHSGHYIVNIRNSSGEWYQFSDDKVERMHNKIEDGINDGGKPPKRGRVSKGCLSSNTAYMLVYKRLPGDTKARRALRASKNRKHDVNNIPTSSAIKPETKIKSDIISEWPESTKRKESSDDDSSTSFNLIKKRKGEKEISTIKNENYSNNDELLLVSKDQVEHCKNNEKISDCHVLKNAVEKIEIDDSPMETNNNNNEHNDDNDNEDVDDNHNEDDEDDGDNNDVDNDGDGDDVDNDDEDDNDDDNDDDDDNDNNNDNDNDSENHNKNDKIKTESFEMKNVSPLANDDENNIDKKDNEHEDDKDTSDEVKNKWEKNYQLLNGDAHRAMSCGERDYYESIEFKKWGVSETLHELIDQENVKYELSLLAIQEEKQKEIENQNIKRQEVIDFYTIINNSIDNDMLEYDWVPTAWLSKWLNDHSGCPDIISPIDNSMLMCTHHKLDPSRVNRAKSIPTDAASLIFDKYKGGPRLNQNSLCEMCVKKRCKTLRFKLELERDHKEVIEVMRNEKEVTDNSYIVGAVSLKYWRRLAMEQLEGSNQDDNNEHENISENIKEEDEEESDGLANFNDDLLCEHNGLRTPDASRKIVPAAAWNILRKYFPAAMEYSAITASCIVCEEKVKNAERAKKDDKIKGRQQKEELSDLFLGKNRNEILKCQNKKFYIVEREFIEAWKRFTRGKHPPTEINNRQLLCDEHLGFLHNPSVTNDLYVIVTADEWTKLSGMYRTDYAIEIKNIGSLTNVELATVPVECKACILAREEKERIDSLTYDKATIYIQCIDDSEENESAVKSSRPSRSRRKAKGSYELKVSSQITLKDLKVMTMNICGAPPYDQHLMLDDHELKDSNQNIGTLGVYPGATLRLKIDTPQDVDVNTESDSVSPEASSPEKGFKGTELVSS